MNKNDLRDILIKENFKPLPIHWMMKSKTKRYVCEKKIMVGVFFIVSVGCKQPRNISKMKVKLVNTLSMK